MILFVTYFTFFCSLSRTLKIDKSFIFQAIKRLQKRNNLTEEEARRRLEAQPTNLEQVAPANIVFSPFWSYEYTQQQIDRAWDHLQQQLAKRKGADTAKL